MFTTKFSTTYLPQFTYSEQLQESEKKLTEVGKIKILVEQIYNAYNQIEYKLQSYAIIAKAAINMCLYNLCGQDPTQQDDKIINNCDAIEESSLTAKYPLIINSFIQDVTRNINSSIKDFIVVSRSVLELDCPRKIENKKLILEIAEYLCKTIKSKFEISNQISTNAKVYKQEIEEVLVFLAKYSCIHYVGWPNTKQLSEQFLKDAERAVYNTGLTLYQHTPYV